MVMNSFAPKAAVASGHFQAPAAPAGSQLQRPARACAGWFPLIHAALSICAWRCAPPQSQHRLAGREAPCEPQAQLDALIPSIMTQPAADDLGAVACARRYGRAAGHAARALVALAVAPLCMAGRAVPNHCPPGRVCWLDMAKPNASAGGAADSSLTLFHRCRLTSAFRGC